MDIPNIEIYTDGACSGNPGPGGWGAILIYKQQKKEIFGYEISTTNNRMEMQAAISALQNLKKTCNITIYTDSKYLYEGATKWINGWKKNGWRSSSNKAVKNIDLWQLLEAETSKHNIIWQWVKGHSNNIGNDLADSLAVKGRDLAIEKAKNS